MSVYVDTSALFAVLDRDDSNHSRAKTTWVDLIQAGTVLYCSNYVVVECCALMQRRLGVKALRVLFEDMLPVLAVKWIEQEHHQAAVQFLLHLKSRSVSLVDCVSFILMRDLGVDRAFVFDKHFADEGFTCLG